MASEEELKNQQEDQLEKGREVIEKLNNKDFKIYFFTLDTQGNPSAGVANVYEHVRMLREVGYDAQIMHEKNEYHGVQDWLEDSYMDLPHVSAESGDLNIAPEDFIIVPEIFSNVMSQVKDLPCKKIVMSQNYYYILELLTMGMKWTDYGFDDVITTSQKQADYIKQHFPAVDTHIVPVGIPDYFKSTDKIKEPVIAISSREQSDTMRIIKSFYLQFPQYKWISFQELRNLPRKQFAEILGKSCLSVWVDNVAGFGTMPIESMECETPVIGKIPEMVPE